jgi:hypothetical protein
MYDACFGSTCASFQISFSLQLVRLQVFSLLLVLVRLGLLKVEVFLPLRLEMLRKVSSKCFSRVTFISLCLILNSCLSFLSLFASPLQSIKPTSGLLKP